MKKKNKSTIFVIFVTLFVIYLMYILFFSKKEGFGEVVEGTIKSFNPDPVKGFGFITTASDEKILLHISSVDRIPNEGDLVEFEIDTDESGKKYAKKVINITPAGFNAPAPAPKPPAAPAPVVSAKPTAPAPTPTAAPAPAPTPTAKAPVRSIQQRECVKWNQKILERTNTNHELKLYNAQCRIKRKSR